MGESCCTDEMVMMIMSEATKNWGRGSSSTIIMIARIKNRCYPFNLRFSKEECPSFYISAEILTPEQEHFWLTSSKLKDFLCSAWKERPKNVVGTF